MQYSLYDRLRGLLNDVQTYTIEKENITLWWKYYYAKLLYEIGALYLEEVEQIFYEIIEKTHKDTLLRAKTLLSLSNILERENYYIQPSVPVKLEKILQECDSLLPDDDWERYFSYIKKSVSRRRVNFQYIYSKLMEVIEFCVHRKDYYGLTSTCQWVKGYSAMHGRWKEFLDIEQKVVNTPNIKSNIMLRSKTYSDWQVARIWMGRYAETERILKEVVEIQTIGREHEGINRDLFYAIIVQGRFSEVISQLELERKKFYTRDQLISKDLAWILRILGVGYLQNNDTVNAKKCFLEAVTIVDMLNDKYTVHDEAIYLGYCCLARFEWKEKRMLYKLSFIPI